MCRDNRHGNIKISEGTTRADLSTGERAFTLSMPMVALRIVEIVQCCAEAGEGSEVDNCGSCQSCHKVALVASAWEVMLYRTAL